MTITVKARGLIHATRENIAKATAQEVHRLGVVFGLDSLNTLTVIDGTSIIREPFEIPCELYYIEIDNQFPIHDKLRYHLQNVKEIVAIQ